MFPGAGASVYYNEAGEPMGWDYAPSLEDIQDTYADYGDEDDADEDGDLDGPAHVREDS